MLLVFLFGAVLAFDAALGASLGLDAVAPDLIASPISLGALGAGAAPCSSSSSSEECCSNSAMGSTLLHHLPLFLSFFPSAATDSLGAGFSGIFCWKYALEVIINKLLLYLLGHDNRLLSML